MFNCGCIVLILTQTGRHCLFLCDQDHGIDKPQQEQISPDQSGRSASHLSK